MPELGQYAAEVLLAYASTAVLIGGLVGWTLIQSRRVKRTLEDRDAP